MLSHEAAGKIVSTHPTRADEGNLAEWEIHTGNLSNVLTAYILRCLAGEWVSKMGGKDVAQFSANEILFCVRYLVLLSGIFVFRYLTKPFWWRIVRIFAVSHGTLQHILLCCLCRILDSAAL